MMSWIFCVLHVQVHVCMCVSARLEAPLDHHDALPPSTFCSDELVANKFPSSSLRHPLRAAKIPHLPPQSLHTYCLAMWVDKYSLSVFNLFHKTCLYEIAVCGQNDCRLVEYIYMYIEAGCIANTKLLTNTSFADHHRRLRQKAEMPRKLSSRNMPPCASGVHPFFALQSHLPRSRRLHPVSI